MFIWILRVIAVLFLIWFIVPIFKGYFNAGNKLGIAICLYILLFYTNTGLFDYIKTLCYSYPALTMLWCIAKWLIYAFVAYAIVITALMINAAHIKPKANATAVTLGIRATKDGPSMLLKGRINASADYLNKNEDTVAILTGGKCKRDYEHESHCMYGVLVDMGIDEPRLYIEDESLSTYENILFAKRIINEHNKEKNLAIITDSFHQLRARLIVKKLGIKTHVGAVNSRTSFLYIPTYYVREWIALPYELLFRFRPHR